MSISVLVVDDDDDIRETLKEALELEDYHVLVAINGADALEVLKLTKVLPNLIILDFMMPIMDGSKFLNIMHTEYKSTFAHIPVILASAKGSLEDLENGHLAREKLKKPIDLDELYLVVGKYRPKP